MEKYIFILLFFLGMSFGLNAQIEINEDVAVSNIMQRHIDQNRSTSRISGWRIQLMASTNRQKIEQEEAKFIGRYPTISVFWEHSKPYYKLKAGAFATKLEATRTLRELKKSYSSAILTKSNVTYLEVLY